MLFSKESFQKCIISNSEWDNIKCSTCNVPLILVNDNGFEEVKYCPECGEQYFLFKKL